MTPTELYSFLLNVFPGAKVPSVCYVETTCKRIGFCPDRQNVSVLDFDYIKDEYYKGEQNKPASVDAVSIGKSGKYFCFVEMKGWMNYFKYQQENSILQTVASYNLDRKLNDSQDLCKSLTQNKDLFSNLPVVFLLVTDIDVKKDGESAFYEMIFDLAETSSERYSECISESKRCLDSEIHISHEYIYCKEFDDYMLTI